MLVCLFCRAVLCYAVRAACCSGVELRYGVDATQLYQGLEGITMSSVQHLVWNFPLAVSAEAAAASAGLSAAQAAKLLGADDEANRQLMGRFLAGVARQMAAWQPNMKVSSGQ